MKGETARRSTRLPGYDYSSAGGYFVTICAAGKRSLFGSMHSAEVGLSELGQLVEECWLAIPQHHPHVAIDYHVVMPNHLHGILMIPYKVGAPPGRGSPTPASTDAADTQTVSAATVQPITRVVGNFKGAVTREFRKLNPAWHGSVWQRSFYDCVIRNEKMLYALREYIELNPLRWHLDRENPDCQGDDGLDALLTGSPARRDV